MKSKVLVLTGALILLSACGESSYTLYKIDLDKQGSEREVVEVFKKSKKDDVNLSDCYKAKNDILLKEQKEEEAQGADAVPSKVKYWCEKGSGAV